MRAGVGHSVNPTSTEAAIEATRAALAQAGTETCDLALLSSLLVPAPDELLELRPVSRQVNSVRNNGPELTVPVH